MSDRDDSGEIAAPCDSSSGSFSCLPVTERVEVPVVIDATPRGYFVICPNCREELRIAAKYVGNNVQCKFCTGPFLFERISSVLKRPAFYVDCPHCKKELRVAEKYLGQKVSCKLCEGAIQFVDPGRESL